MNIEKLQIAEATFLQQYPGGFEDPGLSSIKKRHNVGRLTELAQVELAPAQFSKPTKVCEAIERIISRSSLVSRFEKPGFQRFIESLKPTGRAQFADAFERRLRGRKKAQAFTEIVEILADQKLAKWSVISAVPFYFAPTKEVFVKPTTAKKIIQYLEVEGLEYKPRPSWEFYRGYCKLLKDIQGHVLQVRAPNYAALSGFLMMSI